MNKKAIILIGGGGHCKSCIDVIESTNEFEIAGIVDSQLALGETVFGYPVLGKDEDLATLRKKYEHALITVGQIRSAKVRIKIFELLQSLEFNLPNIVAATAHIGKNVQLGQGTIVMHQVLVNSDTTIGDNCIINSKALVEHDCKVGDHTHISTAATINGTVTIGSECFIGSRVSFVNNIDITDNVFIGINSTISKSITEPGMYLRNPVKKQNK
ncbi:acetyltransferase [Putridiphycobacter roseus]|uniref:Acetyltransferase n=1 Tax=Putridiphycobacter roseus TaxID=2219161 RepID=A0A2W1MWH8_9FLAO|nr:acetyltransferase [Putridiphycobacter roseus]PZE16469.1 acetyltransferase [Putridiphycobacter roseus]